MVRRHQTLKQECPTRWNSILTMGQSLVDLKEPVNEALKRMGLCSHVLDVAEWDLLADLCRFLALFDELTVLVSSNYSGLSLIPLLKDAILSAVQPQLKEHPAIATLKKNIKKHLDQRFPITDTVRLCSLLDPSTKDTLSIPSDEIVDIFKKALDQQSVGVGEANTDKPGKASKQPTNQTAQTEPVSKKRKLLASKCVDSQDEGLANEILRYLNYSPTPEEVDNPFLFWRSHCQEFSSLAELAKQYLTISCSSVPVERMFSTTGIILNGKRSSLAPYKLNQLSFVHDNYNLFH